LILLAWPQGAPVAAVACVAGLFAERWLFFAEAEHVVRLYHGQQRV
jgi:DMSO reductase anchor subunit